MSLSSGCRIVVRPGRAPRLSLLALGGRRSPWSSRSSSSSSSFSFDSRLKASQLSRRVGWSESMSHTWPLSRSLSTIWPRLVRKTRVEVWLSRARGCCGLLAARGDDGAGAAGPGAVAAVAEADRARRVAGDPVGDRGGLARGQVDREQRVSGADEDRRRAGAGLLEDRPPGHPGLGPADDGQAAARRVEHDGHRADRSDGDGVAERLTGQLVGRRFGEARVALLDEGEQLVLGSGDGVHRAVEGDRQRGIVADRGDGLGLVGQAHHRRQADGGVLAGRPQAAGGGVEHRQAAAGHPDGGGAGDGGLLTVRRPHLRGVEGHDDPLGEVDPDDRRAVLDDVEVGVDPGEDGPVELADRLVDAAVGAVAVAGHPDAAVVQLGGVGLVAVGLDGVHGDAAHGHRERDPRHQPRHVRRASALQVTPERHAVSFPLLAPWMPRGC